MNVRTTSAMGMFCGYRFDNVGFANIDLAAKPGPELNARIERERLPCGASQNVSICRYCFIRSSRSARVICLIRSRLKSSTLKLATMMP